MMFLTLYLAKVLFDILHIYVSKQKSHTTERIIMIMLTAITAQDNIQTEGKSKQSTRLGSCLCSTSYFLLVIILILKIGGGRQVGLSFTYVLNKKILFFSCNHRIIKSSFVELDNALFCFWSLSKISSYHNQTCDAKLCSPNTCLLRKQTFQQRISQ